jgi:pyruvate dehydrogenase E2 component (dihydrolipoamide acetyltransferase)
MAREEGVDLSEVTGSGPGGRITKKDLQAHLRKAARKRKAPRLRPAKEAGGQAGRRCVPAPSAAPAAAGTAFPAAPDARFGDYYAEPLSTMRKRIAEHMVRSMHHTSPHVSMVHQIDCTTIVKARAAAKDKFLEQNGVKLTFMPFFMKAAAAALKEFPMVNASLDGEDIIYHRDINLGIAVALESGLIVPVVKNADSLSVVGLQKALNDLAERARKRQLKPDELKESSFSISNYGSYGSIFATPAINQPNTALLGLGALHKAPVVVGDAIAIRSICYATLTIDHRLIDGAMAAQFLEHMRATLEGWGESVL